MALSKKMLEQEPGEIEMLLPWHAAGTLNARDARRVEEALARDPELARQYTVIRKNTPRPSISTKVWARRGCAPSRNCSPPSMRSRSPGLPLRSICVRDGQGFSQASRR